MRTLRELDDTPVAQWTPEETLAHLAATFDEAARDHPEIMERYSVLLTDAAGDAECLSIMRRGLRETLDARHPLPTAKAPGAAA